MSHKNPKYIAWVKQKPCCGCGNPNVDPHHVIGLGLGITGDTASDIHTIPVCRPCHREIHNEPNKYQLPQVRWLMKTQDQAITEEIL